MTPDRTLERAPPLCSPLPRLLPVSCSIPKRCRGGGECRQLLEADRLTFLPVWPNHLQRAGTIARVLLSHAQAELENLRLISLDAALASLGASLCW